MVSCCWNVSLEQLGQQLLWAHDDKYKKMPGKKLKNLGKEALKGTCYFCRKSRKKERSWQRIFGREKREEMASRPVRCFLCPVWECSCLRKHQSPIDWGSLQDLLLRCSGKRVKSLRESKAFAGCQETCVACRSRTIKEDTAQTPAPALTEALMWGFVFHGRNRSASGYTLFLCHPVYVDISQETLQLIVLLAFKGRKPAGCPSLARAAQEGRGETGSSRMRENVAV